MKLSSSLEENEGKQPQVVAWEAQAGQLGRKLGLEQPWTGSHQDSRLKILVDQLTLILQFLWDCTS